MKVAASVFEKTVQKQFDTFVKKVVNNVKKDHHRCIARHEKYEISFSDLLDFQLEKICKGKMDEYDLGQCSHFLVGIDLVKIDHEFLFVAMKGLTKDKRDIVTKL